VKDKVFSLLRGTIQVFVAVNLLISLTLSFVYPDFFHVGLLFTPGTLIYTIPLSLAFYKLVKPLQPYFEGSPEEMSEEFEEVKPDLD